MSTAATRPATLATLRGHLDYFEKLKDDRHQYTPFTDAVRRLLCGSDVEPIATRNPMSELGG